MADFIRVEKPLKPDNFCRGPLPAEYSACRVCGVHVETGINAPLHRLNVECCWLDMLAACPMHLEQARNAMIKWILDGMVEFPPEFVGCHVLIKRTSGNIERFKVMHSLWYKGKLVARVTDGQRMKDVLMDDIFEWNGMNKAQMMADFTTYTMSKLMRGEFDI